MEDEALNRRIKEKIEQRMMLSSRIESFDRPAVRREVARELAAEGVVLAPQAWARLVRDIVDEIQGPQLRAIVTQAAGNSKVLFEALLEGLHDAALMHEQRERGYGS